MRLIDADDFIEYLGLNAENSREENLGEIVTLEDFDRQPIIDAEPVRHGQWIYVDDDIAADKPIFRCSECGELICMSQLKLPKYCSNCGAKMDLND